MQLISLFTLAIASVSAWDQCPADTSNCGSYPGYPIPTTTSSYPGYPGYPIPTTTSSYPGYPGYPIPTTTSSYPGYPGYPIPTPSTGTMFANIFSAPNFKGDTQAFNIGGAWGCVDLPNYQIQSALSTATTQLTFHYGTGCVGHVIKQVQGGFNSTDTPICAGSLFIKLNRYGSC